MAPGKLDHSYLSGRNGKWYTYTGKQVKEQSDSRFACLTLCNAWTIACQALCAWDSPGKNTGVGYHSLLQGIFPTQGSNPDLLHCRQILYHLSHQGSLVVSHKIKHG